MDNWRLLSDCLPAWLSAETEKGAGTEAPASQYREVIPTSSGEQAAPVSLGNAKGRRTHPHELAPLGVRQPLMLRVIEGGRPTGGGDSRAAYRAAAEGVRSREFLKLVVG